MPRATGKDHSQINLDIWSDDDFLDLTPAAQHLYFVLWTSAGLSYCGAGEWRPGKLASRARGWTVAAVEDAAAELSAELFLIIDTETEEYLIRSWIKHDGLYKSPNMAVSMANARVDLASRTLRGVVIHEVRKLAAREPNHAGWKRESVEKLLTAKPIDPAELEPFTPAVTRHLTPDPTLSPTHGPTPPPTHGLTPGSTLNGGVGVNPPANPGPTPAPAPTSCSILHGGLPKSGTSPGQPDAGPPPRTCTQHPNGNSLKACRACEADRIALKAWTDAQAERNRETIKAKARRQRECPLCDDEGWALDADGTVADPARPCTHPAVVNV
jgi:hypothetical protein